MSEAVQITLSICVTIIICILIVSMNFRNSFGKDKIKQKEHADIKICITPTYPRPRQLGTGAIVSSEKRFYIFSGSAALIFTFCFSRSILGCHSRLSSR